MIVCVQGYTAVMLETLSESNTGQVKAVLLGSAVNQDGRSGGLTVSNHVYHILLAHHSACFVFAQYIYVFQLEPRCQTWHMVYGCLQSISQHCYYMPTAKHIWLWCRMIMQLAVVLTLHVHAAVSILLQRCKCIGFLALTNQLETSDCLVQAPHGPSQQALITTAMQRAGIAFLPYVSSHGTGTPLGDPIETGALRKAIAPSSANADGQIFTIGAVKSLTGHLEGTAGLAGLMLCTLQLQQQCAPPLRYRNLNPYVGQSLSGWGVSHRLPIQASPAMLPDQAMPCAGTSSFSMSGVNAHAIISGPVPTEARRSVPNAWSRDNVFSAAVILPGHLLLTRALTQVSRQILQLTRWSILSAKLF